MATSSPGSGFNSNLNWAGLDSKNLQNETQETSVRAEIEKSKTKTRDSEEPGNHAPNSKSSAHKSKDTIEAAGKSPATAPIKGPKKADIFRPSTDSMKKLAIKPSSPSSAKQKEVKNRP